MSNNDPTDDVLAAIASIFDKDKPEAPLAAEHPDDIVHEPKQLADTSGAEVETIDGFSKSGPGPLDAIRFKWTARRDDSGDYFVDETIGAHSRPMVSGPFPKDEVIDFINDQHRAAHERFDRLKDDMTIRPGETIAARREVERAHAEHVASEDQGF